MALPIEGACIYIELKQNYLPRNSDQMTASEFHDSSPPGLSFYPTLYAVPHYL